MGVAQEMTHSPQMIDAVQLLLQDPQSYAPLVEHPELAPVMRALRRMVCIDSFAVSLAYLCHEYLPQFWIKCVGVLVGASKGGFSGLPGDFVAGPDGIITGAIRQPDGWDTL